MGTDPRQHVKPGDKLRIAAEQINFLNGLMRPDTGFKGPALPGYEPGRNVIMARNSSGGDLNRWGVLAITGIEINPSEGETKRRSFEEMPCVVGTMPSATTGAAFCIAVEPIKAGKVGRVVVAGVVQARLTVGGGGSGDRAKPHASRETLQLGADGPARVLWRQSGTGTVWGLVRIDDGGGEVRVGKVTADWAFGTCATVTIWEGEASSGESCKPTQTSPAATIADVRNLSRDVKAQSWVEIARAADGKWYLVEAGSPDDEGSCRKTIGGEDITKWPGWDGTKQQILGHDENGCLKWFDIAECEEGSTGGGGA